jgi:hypothetical protein
LAEWNEVDHFGGWHRGLRGGCFRYDDFLSAAYRDNAVTTYEGITVGFRVAKVFPPTPSAPAVSAWGLATIALATLAVGSLVIRRRQAA